MQKPWVKRDICRAPVSLPCKLTPRKSSPGTESVIFPLGAVEVHGHEVKIRCSDGVSGHSLEAAHPGSPGSPAQALCSGSGGERSRQGRPCRGSSDSRLPDGSEMGSEPRGFSD